MTERGDASVCRLGGYKTLTKVNQCSVRLWSGINGGEKSWEREWGEI